MFKPLTKKIFAALIACTLATNSTPATAQTPTPHSETTYNYARNLPDRDNDGIPDEWEEHGFTDENGNEHPIHLWGADPDTPDVFLQFNWMQPGKDYNYTPAKQTFNDLVDLYHDHGINLHIDAGDYYTNIPNFPHRQGGEIIPHHTYIDQGNSTTALDDIASLLEERKDYFKIGAYIDVKFESKDARHVGLAYYRGNTFYVARKEGESEKDARNTILHELGHLFGLSHQGYVDEGQPLGDWDYPNYKSVMNGLYKDLFNYSEEESTASNYWPFACLSPRRNCYRGEYTVAPDWDNLDFTSTLTGNIYATTGVSEETEKEALNAPRTNTYSKSYGSSETTSETGKYALTLVLPVFLLSMLLSGTLLWLKYNPSQIPLHHYLPSID